MADLESGPVRILALAVPRTVSTALTKCLSSVEGIDIRYELFSYACCVRKIYEEQTGEDMPMDYEGNEERSREAVKLAGDVMRVDLVPERVIYGNVKRELQTCSSKYVFAKEACYTFSDPKSRQYIPTGYKHVFLIRDPYRVFTSYRKALYQQLTDVGLRAGEPLDEEAFDMERDNPLMNANEFFSEILELFNYVRGNLDPEAIVVNTDDLLARPAEVLKKFCHLTGLPYSDSLLQWDASPDITKSWKTAGDDVIKLSSAFYEAAVFSKGFLPPNPAVPMEDFTPDVRRLAEASMPFFKKMNEFKL